MKTIKIGAIIPQENLHMPVGKLAKPNLGRSLNDALKSFVDRRFPKGELGLVWDKKEKRYSMVLKVNGPECLEKATAFEKDHPNFADRFFLIEDGTGTVHLTEYGETHKKLEVVYSPTGQNVAQNVAVAAPTTAPSAAEGEMQKLLDS